MRRNVSGATSFLLVILMILMTMPTAVFAGSISDLNAELVEGNKVTLDDMTVTITNDSVEVGDDDVIDPTKDMTMRVDFSIPDGMDIKAGDYLEVALPEYLIFSNLHETEIKMKVKVGESTIEIVLGNVTVSGSKAVLTFADAIENEDYSGRGGWFSAGLSFDETKVETSEDTVVVTILGNDFTIKVNPAYISLEKTGKADIANAEITWTVTTTPSKADKTYDGYVLKDTLPSSVSLMEDSFTITPSAIDMNNLKVDKAKGTIEYTFGKDVTGIQTITYKTKINDIAKNNNKAMDIINDATLSIADTTTSASFKVTVEPKWISKKGTYKVGDHSVDWTITVNSSKATLKDVVVTDVLATEMTFGSIKIGDNVLTNDVTTSPYYTLEGQTVKIHLGNINESIIINLNTKLDNTVKATVQNKATITWNDEGSSISGGSTGTSDIGTENIGTDITSGFITKIADGKYDFKKNEMPWKITINEAKKEIKKATVVEVFAYNTDEVSGIGNSLKESSINKDALGKYTNDTVNCNQKYIAGSLTLAGAAEIAKNEAFTVKGQYKVTTVSLSGSIEAQIVEVYLGDISTTENVSLRTKYTDKDVYGVNDKYKAKEMTNRAYLYYGDGNSKLYYDATEQHYSHILEKDCAVGYNYVDRTITWRFYVNHNALDIENGIITDTLPKYWDVDGDDFYEIYHGGEVKLGNVTATIKKGEKLTEGEVKELIKKVEITEKDDVKTINFEFNKISDKYVILVKTKLSAEGADKQFTDNKDVKVRNDASMSGSSIAGNQGDWEEVTIKNNLVSKSGALVKDSKGNYTGDAIWKIDVNRNAIHLPTDDLDKVYVIDKLNDYLEPKMDGANYGIRMWEMKLAAGGSWVEDTEVDQKIVQSGITYLNKELRIKLPKINGSYRIELVTRVTSDTVTQINNSAALEGLKTDIVSKNEIVKIEYADGGAWANLAGKINLTKSSEKTGVALEGAVFELYELSDEAKPVETLKYTKVTDKDGKISFGRLKSGTYRLVEVAAPIGYEIDKSSESKIIDIDTSSDKTNIVNLNITNKTLLRAVQLLKTDELGNALDGAEFTLYKNAIADKNVVAKLQSEVNGSVTFKDVAMGVYYITETKAPTGYLESTTATTIKAVVDKTGNVSYFTGENFTETVTGVPTIKNMAYKGKVVISKVDKSRNPLKGAEFTLYDENEKVVGSAVSEGDNGIAKFENIRFGSYTIKETAAPSGYIASGDVISITEKDFAKNNIELAFTVENEKRSSSDGGGGNHNTPSNPVDKLKNDIPDEDVPLNDASSVDMKKEDPKIPVIIEEQDTPLGTLPETGGVAQEIFFGLGAGLVALGAGLRRKMNISK